MVQMLYYIEVSLVNSMVLESMEDWLKLDATERFVIVDKCKAQWNVVFTHFFLELVGNMEMVNC